MPLIFLLSLLNCVAENELKAAKGMWFLIGAPYTGGILPQFAGHFVIEENGALAVPPIGVVKEADKMTMAQLKKALNDLYLSQKRRNDVEVTTEVSLTPAPEIKIPVDMKKNKQALLIGMVNKPGTVVFVGDGLALAKVLKLGGGATVFGATNRLELLSGTTKKICNIKNLEHQKIIVKAGDRIHVPQKQVWGR